MTYTVHGILLVFADAIYVCTWSFCIYLWLSALSLPKFDSIQLLAGAKDWLCSVSCSVVAFPAAITFVITVQ